jgi:hypothetical protein
VQEIQIKPRGQDLKNTRGVEIRLGYNTHIRREFIEIKKSFQNS